MMKNPQDTDNPTPIMDVQGSDQWETTFVERPSSSSYETAPTYTSIPQAPLPQILLGDGGRGPADVYETYHDPFSTASLSDANDAHESRPYSTHHDLTRSPSQYTQKSLTPSQYSSAPPPLPPSQHPSSSNYGDFLSVDIGGKVGGDFDGIHEDIGSPHSGEIRDSFRSDASLMPNKHLDGDDRQEWMKDIEHGGVEGIQPLGQSVCRSLF